MPTKRTDPKYIRAYDRGMLRSAFVSLFWGVIMERKRRGSFTLQALAKILVQTKARSHAGSMAIQTGQLTQSRASQTHST